MPNIVQFPKRKTTRDIRSEVIDNFAKKLAMHMTAVCYANNYHDVPLIMICRAMAKSMIEDDFDYTEDNLNLMLSDDETRERVEAIFMRILKNNNYI